MKELKLTIFTPTYNRGYIIKELHKSLLEQTNKNFEWIVIDDGSNDNTNILFKNILSCDNGFDVTYKYIENGGKHKAINRGIDIARGEYFMIVDSDDKLRNNAVEKIYSWIKSIENEEKFAGIAGFRGFTDEKKNGVFPSEYIEKGYIDCTNLEREKYNLLEDKAEVYNLNILKQYKFPEFVGEKFIPEAIDWNDIANDGFKIRWFNEIIYIGNYLEDGLTRSKNLIQSNFNGYREYVYKELGFRQNFFKKVKLTIILAREAQKKGNNLKRILDKIKGINFILSNVYFFAYIYYFINSRLNKMVKKYIVYNNIM